ncbi:MAG: CvpA family protein [Erysipelotrichaceae bacterium]|nr:CvpA family protein [Erysipelotrichaceae bacterium]
MIIPQNLFIFITLFIIALYIVMIIIGYTKGFLYELISLVYTAFSVLVAWFLSPVLAKLFPLINTEKLGQYKIMIDLFHLEEILNIVAYFVIIFLVMKIFYIFISMLVKSLNKLPVVGKLNKILGAFSGVINATLITLAISMLFTLPIFKNGDAVREQTILKYINSFTASAYSFVMEKIATDQLKIDLKDLKVDELREQFKEWILQFNHE